VHWVYIGFETKLPLYEKFEYTFAFTQPERCSVSLKQVTCVLTKEVGTHDVGKLHKSS
jgi:hypothetical protein